ncbi:hypothetical protein SAMN05443551_0133 [Marivita hallyeonensis]|uniref:Uncharacterized protein n=2 Tax=Marivita hallyeonensis TaxID=996342 RepID=A0A1M5Y749_9RHOB|nr:hypothetical protein SAMN05443551_0133 [Marivita hallyeonensis]
MESKVVDWRLALECLQSSNIFEQGVAFEVFTGEPRDEVVPKVPESTDVPVLLFDYLLKCIEEDVSPEQEEQYEGYVHDKGGAFLALRVPLDPAWKKFNRELTEERYFGRLADFLKKHSSQYQKEVPTHVFEAWSPRQKPFSKIMKSWKSDALLKAYVEDLEEIFQMTF